MGVALNSMIQLVVSVYTCMIYKLDFDVIWMWGVDQTPVS